MERATQRNGRSRHLGLVGPCAYHDLALKHAITLPNSPATIDPGYRGD